MKFQVFSFGIETFMSLDGAARALNNKYVLAKLGDFVIDGNEKRKITKEERDTVFIRSSELSSVQNPSLGGTLPAR